MLTFQILPCLAGRQTDRQADRQTDRQANGQTLNKHADILTIDCLHLSACQHTFNREVHSEPKDLQEWITTGLNSRTELPCMLSTHIGEREAEYMIELFFYHSTQASTHVHATCTYILHTEWETIQRDQRIFPSSPVRAKVS